MTLGKRIASHRKALGLSQETLGERLGVSRQAVSKWETDAAVPDMENLLALSREFAIPLSDLTGTPPENPAPKESRFPLQYFLFPILCAFGGAALMGLLSLLGSNAPQGTPAPPPPERSQVEEVPPPVPAPSSDFALLWTNSDGYEEFLELGIQESFFPFGTSLELTEPEEILKTDFAVMTHHIADCGALRLEYNRVAEETVQETVTRLSTISQSLRTPRQIHCGSPESSLLSAYGDDLIYCLKESSGYTLISHDYYYAYCEGPLVLLFFIAQGQVSGIRAENLMDGAELYDVNHIHRFPVVGGQPDFSLRQDAEKEAVSDTRRVYIAFNQLVTNNNLSAEERYGYRQEVFSLLPYMDWQEFGQLGEADEATTIFALMDFLASQEAYTPSQILWLQMGCTAPGIDGIYADSYSHILSRALFYDPLAYTKALAVAGIPAETMYLAATLSAYDAQCYEMECSTAVSVIEEAIKNCSLTDPETMWAECMITHLITPPDEWELPATTQ